LEILVQEDVSKPLSRRVFAEFSTEVLSLEDVILALSGIIDDEAEGYHRLPFLSAKSEGLEQLDIYTSIRRRRTDRAYVVSNGRNTIYMLDYVVKARRIYHDPVVCIIGPDAERIAERTVRNLKRMLLPKICDMRINDDALTDFAKITGTKKTEVLKEVSKVLEEAEVALKMRLLDEAGKEQVDGRQASVKKGSGRLSRELLEDLKSRRKPPLPIEPIDLQDLASYGIVILFVILMLLAALSRLL